RVDYGVNLPGQQRVDRRFRLGELLREVTGVPFLTGVHLPDSAMSTWFVSLRLPITRCTGNGNNLRRVGVTMMPSASARFGCSSRSTISSSCPEAKCSSQMARQLAIARTEFGAFPATYRRNRIPRWVFWTFATL